MRSFPTSFGYLVVAVLVLLMAIQVDGSSYELMGWLP